VQPAELGYQHGIVMIVLDTHYQWLKGTLDTLQWLITHTQAQPRRECREGLKNLRTYLQSNTDLPTTDLPTFII
jgi:hypothetical protein